VTGRQERRSKQILDDLQETRRCWKLKEKALDRPQWRTRFGNAFGPVSYDEVSDEDETLWTVLDSTL